MDVLGVSCYFHDAAAALLRDGQLVAAVKEERFVLVLGDCVVEKRTLEGPEP